MQTGLRTVPLVTSERRAIRLTRAQRSVSMFGAQAPEHGEGHDAPVKLAQAQHMRLPLPLVTHLHLSDNPLLHLVRTSPRLKPMPFLVVVSFDEGQSGEFGLHGAGQISGISG